MVRPNVAPASAGVPSSWDSLQVALGEIGRSLMPLTHHPSRYAYERHPFKYFATQVSALPIVAAFVRAGVLPHARGPRAAAGPDRRVHRADRPR